MAPQLSTTYHMSIKISHIKEVPPTAHFAALVDTSMRYDDGYGDSHNASYSTLNYVEYIAFSSEQELKEWIIKAQQDKKVFKIISVSPVSFEMNVNITLYS